MENSRFIESGSPIIVIIVVLIILIVTAIMWYIKIGFLTESEYLASNSDNEKAIQKFAKSDKLIVLSFPNFFQCSFPFLSAVLVVFMY